MCRWQHHFWHMNMGCCKKYCILIPTYKQKFLWPYFKHRFDISSLVFAYEVQSHSKVCNTNSYVNLEICMAILQTASLCHWQHHFWHTNMVTFESILYQFLRTITNLYDHILNRYIWYFQRLFLHMNCNLPQMYQIPIPTLIWEFVWLSFKQLVCVASSIIFWHTINMLHRYYITQRNSEIYYHN
jgi:hypothetical protein